MGEEIKKQAKKVAKTAKNSTKNVLKFAIKNPIAVIILIVILIFLMIIMSMCSTLSGITAKFENIDFSAIYSQFYGAEDESLTQAEIDYTEWETDLKTQISDTSSDYPGFDEYRYNVAEIGHLPNETAALLTTFFGEFVYDDELKEILRAFFDEQYKLEFIESAETRYNSENEPYIWRILTVNLFKKNFSNLIEEFSTDEELKIYQNLINSGGNRQFVENPFDFDWKNRISSYFGYRIIFGAKEFHKGLDIPVPEGTEIRAGFDGIVKFSGWNNSYGNYILIENLDNYAVRYAHCSELLFNVGDEVKAGEIIAKSGNTGNSTGAHLHIELIKNGNNLNPFYFLINE